MCKLVILGLGNTILTDDGAGIYVAREVEEKLRGKGQGLRVKVIEASVGGFNLIDILAGYDRAVVIDAIHTKNGKPGEFYELDLAALKPSARLSSLHQIDFATACDLAKKMDVEFPKEFAIFAMEVEDEFSFGEEPTLKVKAAIPKMAESIVDILAKREWI